MTTPSADVTRFVGRWLGEVAETSATRPRHDGPCGPRATCLNCRDIYSTVELLPNRTILTYCCDLNLRPGDRGYEYFAARFE